MKRFYKAAAVRAVADKFEIALDGRPVKTPARASLAVPSATLAQAIADEWDAQGEEIDPRSMPYTGIANAAIDWVEPDKDKFARSLALFGESDLLCYRAEGPSALVDQQARTWDPVLAWARRRFDVDFEVVHGIMHRPQPDMTLKLLGQALASMRPFELAAMSPLVTISGSLIVALALAEGAIDLDTAWNAASLDEAWQFEQWGEDADAAKVLEGRRLEFAAAYRFLKLL